jgi:ABC-2 type transport system ATP-binding protein
MRRDVQTVLASVLVLLILASSGAALGRPVSGNPRKNPAAPLTYQVTRNNESWTMPDGVSLPVSIFSPVAQRAGEVFPVVVFTHGWMLDKSMFESDAIRYASRGYVAVTYTVRGWGGTNGTIDVVGPDCEMKDLSRIITLVSQDARFPVLKDSRGPVVGATGYSLGGLTSYLIAPRLNPRPGDPGDPRVRAVVPMHGATDLLFSLVPNGAGKAFWALMLLGGSYFGNFSAAAVNIMKVLADTSTGPFEKILTAFSTLMSLTVPINHVSDEMMRVLGIFVQRRMADMDQLKSFLDLRSTRWWSDQERDGTVEHPIIVPTLMTTSWNDDLFCPNEALTAFNSMVAAPKRIIVSSGGHAGGYHMQFPGIQPQPDPEQELIEKESAAWFDHFLKGIDNGVERGPAVSYYRGWDAANYGTSSAWPPAGTGDVTYYPGAGTGFREGSLSTSPAAAGSPADILANFGFSGSISLPYFNDMPKMAGVNQSMDIPEKMDLINMPFQRYSYLTRPFDTDLFIEGTPRLAYSYQCSSQFTQLIPRLYEVAPDGKQTLISRGWYEGYSEKTWTRLDNARPFEMMTCCHRLKAGSRLKLEVQTSDLLQSWPVWGFSFIDLFHDGPNATRLILPIAR